MFKITLSSKLTRKQRKQIKEYMHDYFLYDCNIQERFFFRYDDELELWCSGVDNPNGINAAIVQNAVGHAMQEIGVR